MTAHQLIENLRGRLIRIRYNNGGQFVETTMRYIGPDSEYHLMVFEDGTSSTMVISTAFIVWIKSLPEPTIMAEPEAVQPVRYGIELGGSI